jgi:Domain of unknown function (DUF1839)
VTRQLWRLSPEAYNAHPLHENDRAWPESNCYVDLWIELLHASGSEPIAALPFTFGIDFEGDQWTFFKFPAADLAMLYGVELIELNVWRPLVAHVEEQLTLGRPLIVDVDAFYLPDTAGSSYQTEHVKTSIAVQAIDVDPRRLGYFHNAGYYELAGRDFERVLRLDEDPSDGAILPPYVEVAKLGTRPPQTGRALVNASVELLAHHLARKRPDNPFRRYSPRLRADFEWLAREPLAQFHRYSFATFRQFGSAFELGAAYVQWLSRNGETGLEPIAAACDVIATTAKVLQFKTARIVSTGRSFDPAPIIEAMAGAWDQTMMRLTERFGAMAHQG